MLEDLNADQCEHHEEQPQQDNNYGHPAGKPHPRRVISATAATSAPAAAA